MNTSQKVFFGLIAIALVVFFVSFRGQLSVTSDANGCTYQKLMIGGTSFQNFDEINLYYGAANSDEVLEQSGLQERNDGVYSKVCIEATQ